ncbi:MAG: ABC transporter substrate-binding protein [bacterium]|nr:ABC transporter substrate-binding protein [bacterium]
MRQRRLGFAVAGLLAATLALFVPRPGAGQSAAGESASDPLVIAFNGGATTLDPIERSENTTYSWQRHIFDTLTLQGRDGRPEPRIVTAWKSLGPERWQLTLRHGVRFQNGDAMTAADVAESIMDAKTNPKSQVANYVAGVQSAAAAGSDTVDVTTKAPSPLLPVQLTQIPLMPEAYIKRVGRAAFDQHPIGTGPYEFVDWLAQDHLNLKAWSGFWGPKPEFSYVKLESVPNGATRVAALLSGQVQVAEKVDPQDFARVKSSGKAYVTMTGGVRVIYLAMDYWRKSGSAGMAAGSPNPFMDPRVRQAVYQALDIEALKNKIFDGAATVATQFMAPSIEAYDPGVKRLPYDPAAAKRLLAEAGYPKGFSVRLDAPNDRYLDDALVAQALGAMLQQIGIDVSVNAGPKAVFFPSINKGNFSVYMAGWGTTDPVSAYFTLYHCRDKAAGYGTVNREHYCDPKVDAVMAKAAQAFETSKRVELERQAYRLANRKDFAYIPLYYEDVIAGVSDQIAWTSRPDELIFAWQMKRK